MKKYYIIYYKCLIRRSIVLLHIYKSKNSCSLRALGTYDLYKNKSGENTTNFARICITDITVSTEF